MQEDVIMQEIRETREKIMAECKAKNMTLVEFLAQNKSLQEYLANHKVSSNAYPSNSKLDQLALT